jgi:hypothetical protein
MAKNEMQIDITDLARQFDRYLRCCDTGDLTNVNDAETQINKMFELLPSGSGIDNGILFDWLKSKPNRLVFKFSYHHLNSAGSYDGWTHHKLILSPSFTFGCEMNITGKDKGQIKEYLYGLFDAIFFY